MSYRRFLKICRKEFGLLKKDFQFKIAKPNNGGLYYEYSMLNDTTGIKVEYSLQENHVFVKICRLQMGIFPPSIGEMRADSILNCFDLVDLAVVRSQKTLPLSSIGQITNSMTLDETISNIAGLLLDVGTDVLSGDFTIFDKLELIVKERARVNALQKWGDRAHEFGWEPVKSTKSP